MQNDSDETLVKRYLNGLGWQTKKLSEKKGEDGRRPDFLVKTKTGELFYCEVKGPCDPWLSERAAEAAKHGLRFYGGLRSDPTFNRIARQLQKAIKQFRSENPDHLHANVVCIVNHDGRAGIADLYEVCTGFAPAERGPLDVGNRHIAERLSNSGFWETVDLILWIDAGKSQKKPKHFFNLEGQFLQPLCDLFGYDLTKLYRGAA